MSKSYTPICIWVYVMYSKCLLGLGIAQNVHGACQMVLVGKNPPASAGDIRDLGSIPESG